MGGGGGVNRPYFPRACNSNIFYLPKANKGTKIKNLQHKFKSYQHHQKKLQFETNFSLPDSRPQYEDCLVSAWSWSLSCLHCGSLLTVC